MNTVEDVINLGFIKNVIESLQNRIKILDTKIKSLEYKVKILEDKQDPTKYNGLP